MTLLLGVSLKRLTNFQDVLGMQRRLGITQACNVGKVFFAVIIKRSKGKMQLEKTEKQYHVFEIENNLIKVFSKEDVRNYDQK